MTERRLLGSRFRLVDGVVVASAALLALKSLSVLLLGEAPARPEPPPPERPASFGRVLSHARTNYEPADPVMTGSVSPKQGGGDGAAAPPPPQPVAQAEGERPVSAAERAILERLAARREELQQRAREMEMREKLIDDHEKRLDAKQSAARAADEKKPAADAVSAEAASTKSLVTMYETMKPKEAARVFERLPQDVLVPVVRGMNPRKMAEVLAAMSPDAAERLTVALARQARTAPREEAAAALPAGELPGLVLPGPKAR